MKKPLKLNLGCGSNKLKGYVNIDMEASCKPDLVSNFLSEPLPYKAGTVQQVVMFHVIEHIPKVLHTRLLTEIWRVLEMEGNLILAYPEFMKCVANWQLDFRGKREFWEHTLYGLQRYPGDAHVCIMHTPDFIGVLESCGFTHIFTCPEHGEEWNSIVDCNKGCEPVGYEELVKKDQLKHKFKKVKVAA